VRELSTNIKNEIASLNAIPRTIYYMELLDKNTGATNILRLTNHSVNIAYNGETYNTYRIKHSGIKNYLRDQVDHCTVTIDNTDRGMSAYFAFNEFAGQKAEINKIFLDRTGAVIEGYTPWFSAIAKTLGDIVTPMTPNGYSYTCITAGTTNDTEGEPAWPTTIGATVVEADGVKWKCTGTDVDKIVQFSGFMDRPKVNERQISIRIVNVFDRSRSFSPWRRFADKCNWRFCGPECTYNSASGAPHGTVDTGGTTITDTALVGISSMVGGTCKMLTGVNRNNHRKIVSHNTSTGQISFDATFAYGISSGDTYSIECDKSKSTCSGFGNKPNFGGFEAIVQRTNLEPTARAYRPNLLLK